METEHEMTSKVSPSFIHMKPAIQGWNNPPASWINQIGISFNQDKQLKIGNFLQTGVFHYTEDAFLTNNIINTLRY
jgi:hypothetical protein